MRLLQVTGYKYIYYRFACFGNSFSYIFRASKLNIIFHACLYIRKLGWKFSFVHLSNHLSDFLIVFPSFPSFICLALSSFVPFPIVCPSPMFVRCPLSSTDWQKSSTRGRFFLTKMEKPWGRG